MDTMQCGKAIMIVNVKAMKHACMCKNEIVIFFLCYQVVMIALP